ncbi:MBL fold metallo-hydrolase [Oceanibaculum nanhaiense]|uniref:MBL fold metallo-hydrolase n=1 Tax=Oceanibaculum nanhaiense TaxID=1909734 RepID=UPI00396E5831
MKPEINYRFSELPEGGTTMRVADGVYWLRMPLPFALDHINLWLLEDGEGWTIVDTGIGGEKTRTLWEGVFAATLDGRPVTRILVTHFHPDHIGQAGWLTQRWNAPLWMTQAEWLYGRHQRAEDDGSREEVARAFYTRAGVSAEQMPALLERVGRYRKGVEPIPAAYRRMFGGETIRIGNRGWQIIIGEGHCPEHACLACPEDGLLISGDIILPRISPNVSLWPQEPDGDPLARYLGCLDRFADLPADTLVLPSHDTPFTGVHERIANLRQHHQHRLDLILADCAEAPRTGIEVMNAMFTRKLDMMQLGFAIGEALAHLNRLLHDGRLARETGPDGVDRYRTL